MVINGFSADLFLVFAKTLVEEKNGEKVEKVSAFLVEKDFVEVNEAYKMIGLDSTQTCTIHLKDCEVPFGNLIGELGRGYSLAKEVINNTRIEIAPYSVRLLKSLIKSCCKHMTSRQHFDNSISEVAQQNIFEISCESYAIESMMYLVASRMDLSACPIESALLKIYSSESTLKLLDKHLQLFKDEDYVRSFGIDEILRDNLLTLQYLGSNCFLKMFAFLSCIKSKTSTLEKRLRDLTKSTSERTNFKRFERNNDWKLLKLPWKRGKQILNFRRNQNDLEQFIHPRLHHLVKLLENNVDVFYSIFLYHLQRKGKSLIENEIMMEKFTDILMKIFKISSVLSRCNQSIFINSENLENEILLTNFIVERTFCEANEILQEIHPDFQEGYEQEQKIITDKLIEDSEYIFSHPLEVYHHYIEHPAYLQSLAKLQIE